MLIKGGKNWNFKIKNHACLKMKLRFTQICDDFFPFCNTLKNFMLLQMNTTFVNEGLQLY